MKKYFVVADVHGFYNEMTFALLMRGFDQSDPDHVFVSLGDLLDRGPAPASCLSFVNALPADRKILIRGNHEDLLEDCLAREEFYAHDVHNGTMDTVLALAGPNGYDLFQRDADGFFAAVRDNPLLRKYLAETRDYAEIGKNVLVHGWIPDRGTAPDGDPLHGNWKEARWYNGMEKWQEGERLEGRTVLCGHWHTSWGHALIEQRGSEFGEDADFSPFVAPGIVALDACTVLSHKVNCLVLRD